MNYSCCVSMVASDPNGIGFAAIPAVHKAGFDYVDIPLRQSMTLDDRQFEKQVVSELYKTGMSCYSMNDFFAPGMPIVGPRFDRQTVLDYARTALDRAYSIKTQVVIFGSAIARTLPDGYSYAQGRAQLEALLPELGDLAGERGILIVLEPLNRLECNILNSLSESLELMHRLNHPHIRQLVDYYHFALGNEPLESLQLTGGALRYVHFARPLRRGMPQSVDEDNGGYIPFAQTLKRIGYQGIIALEGYAQGEKPLEEQLRHSLGVMRALFE